MKILRYTVPAIDDIVMCSTADRDEIIEKLNEEIRASISSKEITRNMVRVKSSNIWSYAINVRKYGDKTGDVYTQFKGKDGGPGDVYVYYDVPVSLYRRWLTATSKGSFHHRYIRHNYKYSKLTGDKKTHLPNGINQR